MAAAPDKAEKDTSKTPSISRAQALKNAFEDEDYQPDMPPLECGHHVLEYLWEWGPALSGPMGKMQLTHDNLVACQINTGIELSAWESRTLVRLSREFLNESSAAAKLDREPPFDSADAERLERLRRKQRMEAFLYG